MTFNYTARSAQGKFVAGVLRADNREQALAHLRTRALFVTSIAAPDSVGGILSSLLTVMPIGSSARTTFVRSLATLTRAGVPLRRALDIVTRNCRDWRLKEALESLSSDIDSGLALSAAMEKRPREFTKLFIALTRAGELSGTLEHVLERTATLLERDAATRKRLWSALAYPAVVTCAAIGLVLFLVSSTIPAFADLFAQMHVALPPTTRALIVLGTSLREPSTYVAAIGVLGAGCAGSIVARRTAASSLLDRLTLRIPLIGALIRTSILGRFSRTLGTLLRSGVPLLAALDVSVDVLGNAQYAQRIGRVASDLREGAPVAESMERADVYDDLALALVRVGEETGALDEMLLRVAERYELDVETAVAAIAGIVEPCIIVFLGAIVGTIVGSILIPLYSMIGSIK